MRSQKSLRTQILVQVGLPACLAIALLCEFAIQRHEDSAHAILQSQGHLLAAFHAAASADAAVVGDRAKLAQIAREMLSPEIAYVRFTLPDAGAGADAARPGIAPIPLRPAGEHDLEGGTRLIQRGGISVMELAAPIRTFGASPSLSEMSPGTALPATPGELRIGFDMWRVQAAQARFAAAVRGAEGALALCLFAVMWLGVRHSLHPVTRLSEAASRLSAGDHEGELPAGSSREADEIRAALVGTRRRLDEYRTQLASLRARLEARDVDRPLPAPVPVRPIAATPPNERDAEATSVLIVEDDGTNRRIAREMLEDLGCDVHAVEDGVLALAALDVRNYDLVFMDVQMPKLDGLATTVVIREREAESRSARVPVVALTAHVRPADRAQCIDAGMDDFISKPYTRSQLEQAVARWCGSNAAVQPASAAVERADPQLEVVSPAPPEGVAKAAFGESSFAGQRMDTFLLRTDQLLGDLKTALHETNGPRIQSIAHELAESAPQFGAFSLVAAAKELERVARGGGEDLLALARGLIEEIDRTREALTAQRFGADTDA